eukprot:TRINITY_DN29630_c0_g1_i2.p1 TRINITY_DN29630_c0_g1~~TRINITY_DN29630_c0_g1_i2.p1  ORF type:complete len:422 (-),score=63.81 TRINITY_DN29630_c0_g1_i2:30-1124(-)
MSSFHVSFSHTDALPTRGSDVPVLRFVVGKRRNSMTSVGIGNPYLKKEPIDSTNQVDALLTDTPERSRTFWFLYDSNLQVAAMGVQGNPSAASCRLLCRFRDAVGFRAEVCEQVRFVSVSSGKRPVSLRVVHVGAPPDVSIRRNMFDPVSWQELPWQGCSCVFQLDAPHLELVQRLQGLLQASPIGPLYELVRPGCICLNAVRLLDPLRRPELFAGNSNVVSSHEEEVDWHTCHQEVYRRLQHLFFSAPWTFFPLRVERADCTSITLAPTGPGCHKAVWAWVKAVEEATGLRNLATAKEALTLTFAFEVFPVLGENAAQVRRDVVREITALLDKEWGVMEFSLPRLACWQTWTNWEAFQTQAAA